MSNKNFSISINDVTLGYHPQRPLLPTFSVNANKGELIALIGRNGIGKSTLLRSIIGIQKPLAGSIEIEGISNLHLNRKQRALALSYVPSEPVRVANLFIRDFVAIARFPYSGWSRSLSASDWENVDSALNLVGISHLAQRDITTVSDGERQRAMIAFALAQDTRIIILDEPTAFLDLPNKFEMVRLLVHLAHSQSKTIIYSTHDLQGAIHEADKIWMMLKDGFVSGIPEELALAGTFQDLLSNTNVVFDAELGLFRNQRFLNKSIILEGEGIGYFWTARMLERLGYEVNTNPSCETKIIYNSEANTHQWNIYKSDKFVYSCTKLSDLF